MGSKSKTQNHEIETSTKNRKGTKKSKKGKCSGYNKYVDSMGLREKIRTIENIYDNKFGFTIGYTMGSKSKTEIMKSYRINKKEAETKLKSKKRETALDIISKSVLNAARRVRAVLIVIL